MGMHFYSSLILKCYQMKNINFLKFFLFLFLITGFLVIDINAQINVNLASQCNCEVLSGNGVPTPTSPPASAGNLYIDNSTGDIYSFDGMTWSPVANDVSHDWYKENTTTEPTTISDNIYTMGKVGVGTNAPTAGLHLVNDNGAVAAGVFGAGAVPPAGAGTRLVWSSRNAAFRAGQVSGTQWDEASMGNYSAAFGFNTKALGGFSFAGGQNTNANQDHAFAYGVNASANGPSSLAIGNLAVAGSTNSISLGNKATTTAQNSIAIGFETSALGVGGVAIGYQAEATGIGSKSFGAQTLASGYNSTSFGEQTFSRSRGEVTVGMYNTDYTPLAVNSWNAADRIFVVGNGSSNTFRSDALTVYKNGKTHVSELQVAGYSFPTSGGAPNQTLGVLSTGDLGWRNIPNPNTAGNDIDITSGTVNVEPVLDFVHTINSPTAAITGTATLASNTVPAIYVSSTMTRFGLNACPNLFQRNHTMIGKEAGFNISSTPINTTNLTFVGFRAGYNLDTGNDNVFLGHQAGHGYTNANRNISIGYQSAWGQTAGNDNVYIGYRAGYSSGNITNSIAIGTNVSNFSSNFARIGNSATTTIGGQVAWSSFSDARLKSNIVDYEPGLDFIMKLRPVAYNFEGESHQNIRYNGFLAQEVEASMQELGIEFSGMTKPTNDKENYSLRYAEFTVPLVNAVQEQQEEIESLKNEVAELKALLKQVLDNQ